VPEKNHEDRIATDPMKRIHKLLTHANGEILKKKKRNYRQQSPLSLTKEIMIKITVFSFVMSNAKTFQ